MNNLQKYKETLDLIENDIVKIKIKTDEASVKIAATLFVVALDHAHGIKCCLSERVYPSAFSLLRILFETYIRAMWLEKCANKNQLNRFIHDDRLVTRDDKFLKFGDMVLEVEKAHGMGSYLSEVTSHVWSGLNSLTHSGSIQLTHNYNGSTIQHGYNEGHIEEAINFSTMIACLAYSGLCALATNSVDKLESGKIMDFVESWLSNQAGSP